MRQYSNKRALGKSFILGLICLYSRLLTDPAAESLTGVSFLVRTITSDADHRRWTSR
jgi:hypothetical protein